MNPPEVAITGLGIDLPTTRRTNTWWSPSMQSRLRERNLRTFFGARLHEDERGHADAIQREEMAKFADDPFQGARERRVAGPDEASSTMEIAAARRALQGARAEASAIDLLISVACPSDQYQPGNAAAVQRGIGAAPGMAFSLDAACASFAPAIFTARALMREQGFRRAVVTLSSQFSKLVDPEDPMSIMVGDGAAAVVLESQTRGEGLLAFEQRADGATKDAMVCGVPDSPWFRGERPLRAHSRDRALARSSIASVGHDAGVRLGHLFARSGVERHEVRHFFGHQGTAWFNETCRRSAGLEHCGTLDTFPRFGTVGAVNIPLNLWHAQRAGRLARGDLVACYAVGMGLNWSAAIIRWALDGPDAVVDEGP